MKKTVTLISLTLDNSLTCLMVLYIASQTGVLVVGVRILDLGSGTFQNKGSSRELPQPQSIIEPEEIVERCS